MALHVPRAPGFSSMMKDGAKFFSGLEEAVIRNIGKNGAYQYMKLWKLLEFEPVTDAHEYN